MKGIKGRRGKGSSRERKKPARKKHLPARPPAMTHRFLDHPADVGFAAHGRTLPQVFSAAALALCDYGWELNLVKTSEAITLRVRAATLEDLLYSWLSEVLFLTDAEGWVFKSFRVDKVEQTPGREGQALWEAVGQAQGEHFDQERHRARTYIKAVTYHQLAVTQTRSGWQATVYLDV
ncbi:MAG TPA: archease [Candidatus Acidoferrales bacterium]|nr:archease [Candidatus Acidoferrales bacterium]